MSYYLISSSLSANWQSQQYIAWVAKDADFLKGVVTAFRAVL